MVKKMNDVKLIPIDTGVDKVLIDKTLFNAACIDWKEREIKLFSDVHGSTLYKKIKFKNNKYLHSAVDSFYNDIETGCDCITKDHTKDDGLLFVKEQWDEDEWQTILKAFGLRNADKICISGEFKAAVRTYNDSIKIRGIAINSIL